MRKIVLGAVLAACFAVGLQAQIQCTTCPPGANATGLAPGITTKDVNGNFVSVVGACQQIVVQTDLGFKPAIDTTIFAAYYGGSAVVKAFPGTLVTATPESTTPVTPAALATTVI